MTEAPAVDGKRLVADLTALVRIPSVTGSEEAVGMIVNLAYWSDETLTKLSPHEPEPTGVVVSLESRH